LFGIGFCAVLLATAATLKSLYGRELLFRSLNAEVDAQIVTK
jgi:hypothetical protein